MENLGTEVPGGSSLPSAPADETGVTLGHREGGGNQRKKLFLCEVRPLSLPFHQNLQWLAGFYYIPDLQAVRAGPSLEIFPKHKQFSFVIYVGVSVCLDK